MRIERDTMGEVAIPRNAYFGSQTQRAVDNFPISGKRIAADLIHALGLVKKVAAKVNFQLGNFTSCAAPLSEKEVDAIIAAAGEVADGKFDAEFPIDVYQTGSGTSSNMNANEVIANRAIEILGGDRFDPKKQIHPNDHVNLGQSTNDIFPTAIHVATAILIKNTLIPALTTCHKILLQKSQSWNDILKIGRTHLADAVPMTLGQEFSGFARQIELAIERAQLAIEQVLELPAGGTAVGTGLNTHPDFGKLVAKILAELTNIPFVEAKNHFEANAQRDGLVTAHALIKSISVTLMNVANNIRFLSSGPRCGYYEIVLPDLQPGSSIMPGKVNPVLCESLMQVAARVAGNDQTITNAASTGGQFQLNIMMPVLADTTIESINILAAATNIFAKKALEGLEANKSICNNAIERSLAMATGLNPYIGYEKAAAIAKEAFKSGKTVREICNEKNILKPDDLKKALDPIKMTNTERN
ncbi:MAG: class II fumarate hydratase [Planctomycetaceae bacterium]|jgi:fumarate hydratase class II|nr:class II fumarate hydratase [Planctomycetaceae bacterium]